MIMIIIIVNNNNINCCKKIFFDWFIFTVYFFLFNYNSKNRAVRHQYVKKKKNSRAFLKIFRRLSHKNDEECQQEKGGKDITLRFPIVWLAGSYVFALLIGTVAIYDEYVIRLECGI